MQIFHQPQNDNELIATINKYDLAIEINDINTANVLEGLIVGYQAKTAPSTPEGR